MKKELESKLAFTISHFIKISNRRKLRNIAFCISKSEGIEKQILWNEFKRT